MQRINKLKRFVRRVRPHKNYACVQVVGRSFGAEGVIKLVGRSKIFYTSSCHDARKGVEILVRFFKADEKSFSPIVSPVIPACEEGWPADLNSEDLSQRKLSRRKLLEKLESPRPYLRLEKVEILGALLHSFGIETNLELKRLNRRIFRNLAGRSYFTSNETRFKKVTKYFAQIEGESRRTVPRARLLEDFAHTEPFHPGWPKFLVDLLQTSRDPALKIISAKALANAKTYDPETLKTLRNVAGHGESRLAQTAGRGLRALNPTHPAVVLNNQNVPIRTLWNCWRSLKQGEESAADFRYLKQYVGRPIPEDLKWEFALILFKLNPEVDDRKNWHPVSENFWRQLASLFVSDPPRDEYLKYKFARAIGNLQHSDTHREYFSFILRNCDSLHHQTQLRIVNSVKLFLGTKFQIVTEPGGSTSTEDYLRNEIACQMLGWIVQKTGARADLPARVESK
jgi:hypothetical protein